MPPVPVSPTVATAFAASPWLTESGPPVPWTTFAPAKFSEPVGLAESFTTTVPRRHGVVSSVQLSSPHSLASTT
jgi:hypothetical protein